MNVTSTKLHLMHKCWFKICTSCYSVRILIKVVSCIGRDLWPLLILSIGNLAGPLLK